MSRAGIYYAPSDDDPLWRAGTAWLGRDPASGLTIAQPPIAGIDAATASPRRYGFHATLKPPMMCRFGLDALVEDARSLVRDMEPFIAPALTVARLDGFIALIEAAPSAALRRLADACVIALDRHREAEPAAKVTQREAGLDDVGRDYLARFGYPYVLDRWQFHLTLSERLAVPDRLEAAARDYFGAACAMTRMISGIAIYVETEPGAPFSVLTRIGFGG